MSDVVEGDSYGLDVDIFEMRELGVQMDLLHDICNVACNRVDACVSFIDSDSIDGSIKSLRELYDAVNKAVEKTLHIVLKLKSAIGGRSIVFASDVFEDSVEKVRRTYEVLEDVDDIISFCKNCVILMQDLYGRLSDSM